MCGIAGLKRIGGLAGADPEAVRRMTGRLLHRGPDAGGDWCSQASGIALGHRRLSILDISSAGAQPMTSASGRLTIAFNGEIYNFAEVRAELEQKGHAPAWRGHSDTEILLEAIEAFGVMGALSRTSGMFAFAVFDAKDRSLHLARDAFGEKPLYVADLGGAFVFASELKALKEHPSFKPDINRQSVIAFLRHGYSGVTGSIYDGIGQIAPGSVLSLADTGTRESRYWWDHTQHAARARRSRYSGSAAEATSRLDRLINDSVARQSIADVGVGAFLSGGVDSSTVAAVMQAQRSTPIDTFTVGFEEKEFDESDYARDVANHIRSRHHEIILSGEAARDLVTRMPSIYDEPFADPSQLPTFLVAEFARKGVVVCLSGDAGDELFAGYGRYHAIEKRWSTGAQGRALRELTALYIATISSAAVKPALAAGLKSLLGRRLRPLEMRLADKRAPLSATTGLDAYEKSFTITNEAHRFVIGGQPIVDPAIFSIGSFAGEWTLLEQMTMLDVYRYLPDNILVKVDRAAMAHSLETRIPLLDPAIAQFAWSLPDEVRLLNGERKGLLKAVLGRYVPRTLWDRPKRGFGIPVSKWLKGPLRDLANDLFSPATLARRGLLDPRLVTEVWQDFLTGGQRRTNLVWALFVLQLHMECDQAA